QLDPAVQPAVPAAREDVPQEWLIEPHRAQRSAAVVDRRFEDLEPGPPRRSEAARHHAPRDRCGPSRLQRSDRLQAAAIFVAEREAVQEILDRDEADALEIRGAARADPFQELQWRRENGIGGRIGNGARKGVGPLFAHCTIMVCPRWTWISRMRAGSANGSSRLMPAGLSGVLE